MAYFVVINEQGAGWAASRSMRAQALWAEHAQFVNSLMYRGFIVLAGPLGDGHPHRALLVVDAESEVAVRARLLEDPWMRAEILRIASVTPWTILVSHDRLDVALGEVKALAASETSAVPASSNTADPTGSR
jgi:uncharacterized protein YciI